MTVHMDIPENSDFTLANIPFGIFSTAANQKPRPGTAIGNHVLDLSYLADRQIFSTLLPASSDTGRVLAALKEETLNSFASLGKEIRIGVREAIISLLQSDKQWLFELDEAWVRREDAVMHLPMRIGDYTDFYAGQNHARNVGILFRGAANALQPNYSHLPVGYHGRASTVVISNTPIRRPIGQTCPPTNTTPNFGTCAKLDIELELAAFISVGNGMGDPIDIDNAEDHIFGYVLMNDWSARDIQAWEYVPLGPFNSKNFGTTVSPWVVTGEALEAARKPRLEGGELLPYLRETRRKGKEVFDIKLQVSLKPFDHDTKYTVFQSNASNLVFSFPQMIAHHTITGCAMNTGDLLGSGTISGDDTASVGSFLEASQNGKTAIELAPGVSRKWLEDGDEVTLSGSAGEGANRVGFGECNGKILPAKWRKWDAVEGQKK